MKNLFITVVFLLTACATQKIDVNRLNSLKKGVTTYDEVIQMFGKPDRISPMQDGMYIAYMYDNNRPSAVDFIPVVGAVNSVRKIGEGIDQQMVGIYFDSNGKYKSNMVSQNTFR